ncbi:hypothetical protein ACQBAT_10215 [Ornithinimicrobium sp. Y1847]|uniref:hypothetical protein n=1 Tax=unclassified Ornithinimicrobium TaxID=2615080 RepID=UPI003B6828B8
MTSSESRRRDHADAGSSTIKEVADRAPEEVEDLKDSALGRGSKDKRDEVKERWENRLAWPVLIAALVSVPAVFLTLFDEPFETIGHIGLYAVTVVLVLETVVFFLVSPEKIAWIRRNWWLLGGSAAAVLAVVFSIGPLQLFRALRSVGALRVLRAKQVARAGESLGSSDKGNKRRILGKVLATVVVGAFVVIAMVDSDSEARVFLTDLVGEDLAIAAAWVAGLVTVVGMYFLVRDPKDEDDDQHDEDDDEVEGQKNDDEDDEDQDEHAA